MFVCVWVRAGVVLLASLLVGSCGSLGPVRGISPTLQAADVQRASENTEGILRALAADTGLKEPRDDMWYLVSEAGLNYVDDRCSAYFYSLFRLSRRREAVKSSLGAFGQTTNAILQATGATTVSMTVVAQAFGLGMAMTDIVAGTYLFTLPPATTWNFVRVVQRAYRAKAAQTSHEITGPTTAYQRIQRYLVLCLPPSIEGEIIKQLNTAKAVATAQPGAPIEVLVGTGNPAVIKALLRQPNMPLRGTATTAVQTTRRRTEAPGWEQVTGCGASIDVPTARRIQRGLCLPESSIDGVYGSRTAASLKLWQTTNRGFYDAANWRSTDVQLCPAQINGLRNTHCESGARNYLENWLLDRGFVSQLSEKLGLGQGNAITPTMRVRISTYKYQNDLDVGPDRTLDDEITPDYLKHIGIKFQ